MYVYRCIHRIQYERPLNQSASKAWRWDLCHSVNIFHQTTKQPNTVFLVALMLASCTNI